MESQLLTDLVRALASINAALVMTNRHLQRLVEYEEERRVEERRLTAMAESILPAKREAMTDLELPSLDWEAAEWDEELPSEVGQSPRGEDWWYRDNARIYRERGTDRPLGQDEIDFIHTPPGRDRPRRVLA